MRSLREQQRKLADREERVITASLVFNKAKASSLAGLEEGLQGMKRGGVREVVIPANVGLRAKVAGLPSGPSPFPLRVLVKLEEVSPSYAFS